MVVLFLLSFVLLLLSVVALVWGLISPKSLLKSAKPELVSRKNVLLIFGALSILFFTTTGLAASKVSYAPTIDIISSTAPVKGSQYELAATIDPSNATVTVDGKGVGIDSQGKLDTLLSLAEGNDQITIVATDKQGTTQQVVNVHRYTKAELAAQVKKAVNTKAAANTNQPKQTTQTEPSIVSLNAQSVTILTPVLTDFNQQMSQGQSDAAQSNAGDVSSAFHTWEQNEQDKQNVSNNNEEVAAYNKADNAYYNAHQTAPDALSNWDADAGSLPGDMTEWANAEELVAQDNVTGSSSLSTDQQAAANDLQQYKSDLAKAQADLAQL